MACAPCRTPGCASHAINMFIRTHFENGAQTFKVLPSFAGRRANDGPALVPLIEFMIKDSARNRHPPLPARRLLARGGLHGASLAGPGGRLGPGPWAWPPDSKFEFGWARHSSRSGAWRSTDIRIECSAHACLCCHFRGRRVQQLYTLPCILVARKMSRDKLFRIARIPASICKCARPSLRRKVTRRLAICFDNVHNIIMELKKW